MRSRGGENFQSSPRLMICAKLRLAPRRTRIPALAYLPLNAKTKLSP